MIYDKFPLPVEFNRDLEGAPITHNESSEFKFSVSNESSEFSNEFTDVGFIASVLIMNDVLVIELFSL